MTKMEIRNPKESILNNEHRHYLERYSLPTQTAQYGAIHFEQKSIKIWGQVWLPENPKGIVNLIHGLNEHTGNYSQLIHDFLDMQYGVSAIDLQGFGLSGGKGGHTETADSYVEDIEHWLQILNKSLAFPLPLFLWCHSLGGQLCIQLLLREKLPQKPNAICLSNPFLGFPILDPINHILLDITPLLSKIIPDLSLPAGRLEKKISRNKQYLRARSKDPLISRTKITPRWVMFRQQVIDSINKQYDFFHTEVPILEMISIQDLIISVKAAQDFGTKALCTPQHRVVEFEDLYHEIEKEEDRYKAIEETRNWIEKHTSTT